MNKLIGLDIGIASVGWAVIDDEYNVIEAGSNLFEAADASKNVERRVNRQRKRLIRREQNRISDFNKLWQKCNLSIPQNINYNPLELRKKSLKEKINIDELYFVLKNALKHRGISYLDDAFDENESGKNEYSKGLNINHEQLKTKYPYEIQLERLEKYGKYRGRIETINEDGEKIILNNVFTKSAYRKEIIDILENQKQFHSDIDDKIVDEYIKIFDRKREYYVGPGNELSRTDYGKYTTQINPKTGEYITEENIFEKLIGKCSVYPTETRAAGASYSAQEFNLLNDLNNLTINERKLEKKEKEEIVAIIKCSNSVNMRRIIKKVINEDIETMTGARIDKNEKEIFHSFEQYNKIRKELEKIERSIDEFSIEELDKLGEILTLNTDKEAIISALEREGMILDQEVKECLINVRKKNSSLFSKWQSFSLKIMKELIPEMYEKPKNQMQLLTDMGVFKTNTEKFKKYNKISRELITEEIYNPVVCRSVRVTIDVINALIKKYGYPEEIVVEMPRDKNSDEQKKRIKEEQKKNEKELEDIIKKIKAEYGIQVSKEDLRKNRKLPLKLKLWNEQNGICLYSGKPIEIFELIKNDGTFEIDHIIPRSISFDDSRSNKVLVYSTENQKKGNLTPYMYLMNLNREWNFDRYRKEVLNLKDTKKISKKKIDNLLFMQDITKIDVLKGFINRNLNDTRYSSRVILNTLQSYFDAKDSKTKVKVIRGSFTNQMRKNMYLKKDREESFSHHAVDAMLVCYSQMGYEAYKKLQSEFIDFETGEILDKNMWDKNISDEVYEDILYQSRWLQIKNNIVDAEKRIKYWHKVDKKVNRGLCNQTIRGTREIDGKIMKINKLDIYSRDGYETFVKMIKGNKENKFLMYRNDPKTFDNLMTIYNDYKDEKNAFVEYEKETGDYVRKYSKKHNGAKITQLKYIDGEVRSCIDISHKYGLKKGSKRVILESLNPYRADVYYNEETDFYRIIGLKYSDFKFVKGNIEIDEESYTNILQKEKMIEEGENRFDLKEKGYVFKFSLYKNDIILYEKDGEIFEERFLSRTLPNKKNYIETKPVDASKFKEKKQNLVGLSNTKLIKKIRVDILGNKYVCDQEKFELRVDKRE